MNTALFFSELKRKAFHLTGLVYVALAYFLPHPQLVVTLITMFALALMVEILRLRVPAVKEMFFKHFGALMRESETQRFTGVIWLLAGVLVTAFILNDRALMMTSILYVIIGDTAASLIGISVGGPKWPNSNKTVSGSLACFICCVGMAAALLRPAYAWTGIISSSIVACVVESGMIKVNDNFLIPAASALAFSFAYGLI